MVILFIASHSALLAAIGFMMRKNERKRESQALAAFTRAEKSGAFLDGGVESIEVTHARGSFVGRYATRKCHMSRRTRNELQPAANDFLPQKF